MTDLDTGPLPRETLSGDPTASVPTEGDRTPAAYEATRNRDNRERIRLSCLDLTRLADACGWEWTLDSHRVAAGEVVYEVRVQGPGGDDAET